MFWSTTQCKPFHLHKLPRHWPSRLNIPVWHNPRVITADYSLYYLIWSMEFYPLFQTWKKPDPLSFMDSQLWLMVMWWAKCKLKTSAQCLMVKGQTFLTKNPWVCLLQRLTDSKTRTGAKMHEDGYFTILLTVPQSKEKTEIQRNVKLCTTVYA